MTKPDLVKDEWPYSPKFQEFANFLGVPASKDAKGVNWRYDKKFARKIEKIYQWAKLKTKSDDDLDIMIATKQLIRDLGVSFKGATLVNHLHGFTLLDSQTLQKQEELSTIEKEKELFQDPIQREDAEPQRERTERNTEGGT